jgi:hypothetical protein
VRHEIVGHGAVEHDDLYLRVRFDLVEDLLEEPDFGRADDVERRIVEGNLLVGHAPVRQADPGGRRVLVGRRCGHGRCS